MAPAKRCNRVKPCCASEPVSETGHPYALLCSGAYSVSRRYRRCPMHSGRPSGARPTDGDVHGRKVEASPLPTIPQHAPKVTELSGGGCGFGGGDGLGSCVFGGRRPRLRLAIPPPISRIQCTFRMLRSVGPPVPRRRSGGIRSNLLSRTPEPESRIGMGLSRSCPLGHQARTPGRRFTQSGGAVAPR